MRHHTASADRRCRDRCLSCLFCLLRHVGVLHRRHPQLAGGWRHIATRCGKTCCELWELWHRFCSSMDSPTGHRGHFGAAEMETGGFGGSMFSELNRLRPTIYAVSLPPLGQTGRQAGPATARRRSGSRSPWSGKSGAAGWLQRAHGSSDAGRGAQGSQDKH